MGDVVLCYPRQDATFVEELDRALLLDGVPSFYSRRLFPSGGDWRPAVFSRIEGAHCLLVVLTADLVRSERCQEELACALSRARPLLVVDREGLAATAEAPLRSADRVAFSAERPLARAFTELRRHRLLACFTPNGPSPAAGSDPSGSTPASTRSAPVP